ncbi:hypothetical protein QJS10_CPB04g00845 [Acorus calamus]|uniref:RING-type domain-containing protein n=1 Tax=Acorus calamus TaxID=4465 RepID=A0AAV9EYH9_ACOCL|nr:hypothetical protein QJS10_CPB04g00845 [Acorus calamus]
MGLGESENEKDSGGGGEGSVFCSICLEAVVVSGNGGRSTAKLLCGHDFHLDCIGSAFNVKGLMQCPNCRKTEKGNWLYANGYRPCPEVSMDERTHDEDLYDFSEQAFGFHWCPYSRYAQGPSSFEEGELPSIGYHDLFGYHTVFAEHAATSSAAQACPYVAVFQPFQPSSSNSQASTEASIDGPTFPGSWSGTGSSDIPTSHAFASADIHYSGWEHVSAPFSPPTSHINGGDQSSVPFSTTMAGSFMHPYICGPGSGSRPANSVSIVPPPPPPRGHSHPREVHTSHQHSATPPPFSGPRRPPGGMRGMVPIGPSSLSSSDHSAFYLYPPTRPIQEVENPGGNHFYAWERDRFTPYPLVPVDRDSSWWGLFHQSTGGSELNRPNLWHQHGSERPPSTQARPDSSSYRSIQPPRMHPFI